MSSSSSTEKTNPSASTVPYVITEEDGLEKVVLTDNGCSIEMYLGSGHVTSWKNNKGEELLFLGSTKFIDEGPGGSKWFDKYRFWVIDNDPLPFPTNSLTSSSRAFVDLKLKPPSDLARKYMPHNFDFRLRIALSPEGELLLVSRVGNRNTNGKRFSFTFAYDTYFPVSDINDVRLEGLEGMDYIDNLKNGAHFQGENDVAIESEVDRVYRETPDKIVISDILLKQGFVVCKDGLPDTVVWNPWDKAKDFGKEEYKHMVRFGAAASAMNPVTLRPDKMWTGTVKVSRVRSLPVN